MADSKILYSDINGIKPLDFEDEHNVEWRNNTLHVKRVLSFVEMLIFVNEVVSSCFVESTNAYIPEIKDFAIRCAILEHYGNIELPFDLNQKYEIVYGSDICNVITENISRGQLENMMEAIDRKMDNLAQSNIEALNKQLTDAVSAFENLEERVSTAFTGISDDTISKIAGAISDGTFNEEKLVAATKKYNAENSGTDSVNNGDE